jgi:mono/diheme cytochrome c family protein
MKSCAAFAALVLTLSALPALAANESPQVKRGAHLVLTGGCNDCHTPFRMGPKGPEPDSARMLSGHPENIVLPPPPPLNDAWNNVGSATNTAYAGLWGITYAINLTPDPETGIGKWREHDFVQAIKTGKHLGVGRPIMPPMPWQSYRHLSDADLKAMFAYLKSIPPIRNRVPDYVPPATK